jgi:hypothetical protein
VRDFTPSFRYALPDEVTSVGSVLRLLDDRDALRPLAITGVTFGVLQTIGLARHETRSTGVVLPPPSTWPCWPS